jgi:protein O-GlcNAc transferase
MIKTSRGATEHRPRLSLLLQGARGLEISLAGEALPGVLLEINELLRSGQAEEARARFDEDVLYAVQGCVDKDPGCTDIMYIAARLLLETDQYESAERFFRMILEREPHPVVLADLARLIQQDSTRNSEAGIYWQRAWDLDPDKLEYLLEYASCVRDIGDVKGSIRLLERAAVLAPCHCGLESQLLWSLNYVPGYDRVDCHRRATQWAEKHLSEISGFTSYANEPSLTKKLRIGLVSGDFLDNSPMTFFAPALATVNREAFALYAYSNVPVADDGTDRFTALFDGFRDVHGISDYEMATQIRQDGIDILIAFGGRCKGNRLGVMALQPAPVQVDWGALCTLGFPQIDYRITDDILDPPNSQPYHTEELVYLPGGFITYQPPRESPAVTPLPAQVNDYITFGSFNNHLKINDFVLDLWGQILRRVPRSQMVLKFPGARDPGVREIMMQRFAQRGLDTKRVKLCGPTEYNDHLCLMGQVDMLLDSYPFNGFRTTLEGLWMGVPTITMSGTTFVSRTGLAVMKQLGLDVAFVAQTPQAYVDQACAYAEQLDELACIRGALRKLLLSSSICDPKRFAQALEDAFRTMWQQWCQDQKIDDRR